MAEKRLRYRHFYLNSLFGGDGAKYGITAETDPLCRIVSTFHTYDIDTEHIDNDFYVVRERSRSMRRIRAIERRFRREVEALGYSCPERGSGEATEITNCPFETCIEVLRPIVRDLRAEWRNESRARYGINRREFGPNVVDLRQQREARS